MQWSNRTTDVLREVLPWTVALALTCILVGGALVCEWLTLTHG